MIAGTGRIEKTRQQSRKLDAGEGVDMGKRAEAEGKGLRTSLSVKMLGFEREGATIQG